MLPPQRVCVEDFLPLYPVEVQTGVAAEIPAAKKESEQGGESSHG